MIKTKFILGEDKYVKVLIHSPDDEPFEIENAEFELSFYGEVEARGTCLIEEHYISVKLCPQKTGTYTLILSYQVGVTTRKVKICLEVD